MDNLIIYSLELTISLALFYSAYWLFLKNETFFRLNRFYLVTSVVISLSVPLLNITTGASDGEDSFISKYLVLPIEHFEQRIIGTIPTKNETAASESKENLARRKATTISHTGGIESGLAPLTPLNSQEDANSGGTINWLSVGLAIYFTGVALFLIRFIINFIWIFAYVLRHKPQQISGMKVIRSEKNISPFSFLNLVFISRKEYPEDELDKIISHEKVHIQQKHSIDLILFELLFIFQWFNPFAWMYKRAIKMTHEYLADLGTLNSGIDLQGYQYSLLNQVLRENNFEIASSYSFSVKKRIAMMMQKRSSKLSALKLIIALPILIFLFSAFAFSSNSSDKASHQKNKSLAFRDTSVNVPTEYLKLLEGEYVSTNDPTGVRRIIFTEVMGTLFGYDKGYTYKIIPLGGEKFYNPDDKASLIFDSKDKNAISLLLFGKITLKKVKPVKGSGDLPNRSLAFTSVNMMLKNGIAAGLSFYKRAKDSSNYFFTEDEMNYAGYELLQKGKTKESVAIFKLNTEAFPHSFNVYDSYGEALMALGEKNQAIENYKKSVQLNPGSKNGLKVLKELGINTDGLVKEVKLTSEYLNLLEGDYLSTNQPNWVRWIRFAEENGVLFGNDNGYHYSLIPMGDGKFINPDDGASLVFDTKDKNAITLVLFGKINLKKVKAVKETDVNLKKYLGVYLPPKEDPYLKPMEIFFKDNKLFRLIESDPPGPNRTVELQLVMDNTFFYTDNSGRSLEFIVNDKNEVTGGILKRPDGTFKLTKQK